MYYYHLYYTPVELYNNGHNARTRAHATHKKLFNDGVTC